jgi:hypothetical protein
VRERERRALARNRIREAVWRWAVQRVVGAAVAAARGRRGAAARVLQARLRTARLRALLALQLAVRAAAVDVQRTWRGHHGRHFYLRELSRQWRGAVPIQAAVRRSLVRPFVLQLRTEDAAQTLRRVLHMWMVRRRFVVAMRGERRASAARCLSPCCFRTLFCPKRCSRGAMGGGVSGAVLSFVS